MSTNIVVKRGKLYQLHTLVCPENADTRAVRFEFITDTPGILAPQSLRTRISATGVLTVGIDEKNDNFGIRVFTTWNNSDDLNIQVPLTYDVLFTVVGNRWPIWPFKHPHDNEVVPCDLPPQVVLVCEHETTVTCDGCATV